MKDRIRQFIEAENKTAAQFAQEIGIQPSGVSHVLSGRNKPSLDFIIKMLERYSDLSTDWLLFGKGEMFRSRLEPDLFDYMDEKENNSTSEDKESILLSENSVKTITSEKDNESEDNFSSPIEGSSERIIIFFPDGTFNEYKRRKQP